MSVFVVTRKADGAEVYRYASAAQIEWQGMEFVTHDHTLLPDESVVEPPAPSPMVWTKLEYLRRFTQDERIAIRATAEAVPALADYLALMELAEEVRSDDPDVIGALMMLEGAGLLAAGRAEEILNG